MTVSVSDDFNRAAGSLGADYVSPAGSAGYGDLESVIVAPGRVTSDGNNRSSAIYTGDGELSGDCWCEVIHAADIPTGDNSYYGPSGSSGYYYNYGYISAVLNRPAEAEHPGSGQKVYFGIYTIYHPSSYTSPSYDELYCSIIPNNPAGNYSVISNVSVPGYGWPPTLLFDDPGPGDLNSRIPAGTKLRLERVGNTYHGYIYSPDRGKWYLMTTAVINPSSQGDGPGYPGFIVSSWQPGNAEVANFSAGEDPSDFLTNQLLAGGRFIGDLTTDVVYDLISNNVI